MDKQLGFFPKHWESPSPLLGSDFMPFEAVDTCGDALDSQHLSQGPRRGGQERPLCSPAPPHSHSTTAPLPLPLSLFPFSIIAVRAGPAWRSAKCVLCTSSSYPSCLALRKASIQCLSFARSSAGTLWLSSKFQDSRQTSHLGIYPPALPHSLSPGRRARRPPAHSAVTGGSHRPPRAPCWASRASSSSHILTRPL